MIDKQNLVEVLSKALPNWSFDEQSFIGPGIRRRVPIEALVELANAMAASKQSASQVDGEVLRLRVTLERAQRLCKEALPKFNWGASFLDGNAIQLLNEVPAEIAAALNPGEQDGR